MLLLTTHAMVAWTAAVFAWGSFSGWLQRDEGPHGQSIPPASPSDTIQGAKQVLNYTVSRGEQMAREATEEASSIIRSRVVDTKDAALDAVEWTKEKASDALHWTKDAASHAQDKASTILHRFQRIMGIHRAHPQSVKVRILPEEYYLVIDAPGLPVEAVTVQVARDQLIVTGQTERCWRGGRGQRVCVEKSVEEVFELPEDAEQAQITSWMDSQLLIVKIPRKAIVADHVVQVKPSATLRQASDL